MRVHTAFIFLCFGTVGLLAAPDQSYRSASAAGFGPGGFQYKTDPNGVFISGPGYYAGATTFNGVPPNFQFPSFNFPAFQFPTFPNFFGGPGTYAPNFPFNLGNIYQSYLSALAQNTAAIANRQNFRPMKYSANPKASHSSSSSSASNIHFPGSGFPQNPFFPPLPPQQPLPFDSFLGNRFGEEQGGVGNSVSSSSSVISTGKPGSGTSGTFTSTVQGSSNVNGQQENFHVSTTGVHENGQVTSVTVHKP